jgi:hypothetical protein
VHRVGFTVPISTALPLLLQVYALGSWLHSEISAIHSWILFQFLPRVLLVFALPSLITPLPPRKYKSSGVRPSVQVPTSLRSHWSSNNPDSLTACTFGDCPVAAGCPGVGLVPNNPAMPWFMWFPWTRRYPLWFSRCMFTNYIFIYIYIYIYIQSKTTFIIHSFIHSIGMCRMRRFLAVLRSFFRSSLLDTDSSTNYSSILPHFILQSVSWSCIQIHTQYAFGNSVFFHSIYKPMPTIYVALLSLLWWVLLTIA